MGMRDRRAEKRLAGLIFRFRNLAVCVGEFYFSALDHVNDDIRMRMHRDLVALLEGGVDDTHPLVVNQHLGLVRRRLDELHGAHLGGKQTGCQYESNMH